MKKINENVTFLIMILVVFVLGMSVFVRSEKDISVAENRELYSFQHFTMEDFLSGDFQDNFEKAISDQFLLSEQIRVSYKHVTTHLPTFGIQDGICHNNYLELETNDGRERGTFNCEDYILYLTEPLSNEKQQIVGKNIQKYNHLNKLSNVYYYVVDDPSSFDFRTSERVNNYYDWLKKDLVGAANLDRLKYDNYEQYKGFFYKNDHHWDYRGSYQGFLDIAKMLGVKNTIKPIEILTNHECFYGSYARTTGNYDNCEEFSFYDFAIPDHDTLINGEKKPYNHFDEYKKHDYTYEETTNYYAYVYGDDYAEIVFDFDQPKEDNLLIISNSYSNAVNELIAQYFNKTYVVDLRHFKETFNRDFVPGDYIKENNIDKVLVLISPTMIWDEWPNRGLEL